MTDLLNVSADRRGTLPKGTFDAVIREIATVRRKEDRSHALRVIVRTVGLDRDALVWQGLADADRDDPFDLTSTQATAVNRFAERLGIVFDYSPPIGAMPYRMLPERLVEMRDNGEIVQLKVTHGKGFQRTSLYREAPVIIAPGAVSATTEDAAALAQNAHEKVLTGLRAVRLGLAGAAEGCHLLHQSKGWRALGYDTLSTYLAAPEVTLSRSEFYALSEIWQRYILDGGLDAIMLGTAERTKLEVPLPALDKGLVSAEQAVADATSMPREDLRTHYADLLGTNGKVSRQRDVSSVPVDVARRFVVVLQRVMLEVGAPEQKRMGQDLRGALREVLELAREQGLDVEETTP